MGSFDNSFNFDCVVGNSLFCLVCHFICLCCIWLLAVKRNLDRNYRRDSKQPAEH